MRRRSAGIVVGAVVRPVRGRWFGGEPGGTRRRGLACRAPSCIAARCAGCGGHPAAHVANGLVSEALRGSVRGVIQFASARFAVVSDDTFLVLLLVAPVFLLVLLCAWLPKREQNFMLVFHLSFVVALLALFPVNPGTPISLNVSVAFCLLWIGSLVGSLLVMGSRVNRALRPWCDPCGLGPAAFCLGVAAGALVAIGWTMTPDFETVASGSPDGIVKVSVVTSFALIVLFCATNVVLRGSMLRRVELIARGRITQVMPAPRSFSGSEAHGEGDAPDALQDAYRRIAFDRGLTPRELDVLVVLGRGNTLARVQSELVISEGTAITHRRNIYRKLDVHSKQELLDFVERYARA